MSTQTASTPLAGAEARRAARNAATMAVARIISSGTLFLWSLILGKLLGEFDLGIYGTINALYGIGVAITAFSMSQIVIRDVARQPNLAGKYLSTTLVLQTLFALLAYVILNAAARALGYDESLRALTAVACISLFIDMAGNMCYDQLLAQERMVPTALLELGHVVVRIALAGLALWAGFGLLGIYAVTLFTGSLRSVLLWIMLLRTGVRPSFPVNWAIARPLLINSAPLALSSFINITYIRIDQLMTTSLLTHADTGHLTLAFFFVSGVIEILSTTVLIAIYPMMSRAYRPGSDDNATFFFMVEKLSFFTLLIGVPLGLLFTRFSTDIIVPLFGENYHATADILHTLIWYTVTTMVVNVFSQATMVQNRQRFYVAVRAGGLTLKLVLNLLLLPRIGVVGAALASVTAEILVLALLSSTFHLHWNTLSPRLFKLAGVALLSGAAM
ncbi:MAG: oligosaccharide flippase family protein, partial [Candidatus Methanoperedens sp.]|nr:oligosaccharide flippase family protein [Candidatus Methanoperedens sp.]